jgi:hypothetical protein
LWPGPPSPQIYTVTQPCERERERETIERVYGVSVVAVEKDPMKDFSKPLSETV